MPNQQQVQQTYARLNGEVFANRLPKIMVVFDDLSDSDVVGCWDPSTKRIYLDKALSPRQRQAVLLHEMLHVEQWYQRGRCNHGWFFQKRCKQIKRLHGLFVG